jgi:DNA integrity scanning protein DisA with diadenylate cyclase activity
LFRLYRTLHRLGTWKIVSGILVALLVFAAANALDLKGIEWIYSNVSHVAVIALIVIFQPELRKVFERAASLRRGRAGKGASEPALLLGEAAFALAQRRHGQFW